MSNSRIIGVDCATKATKVGLAVADFDQGSLGLRHVEKGRGQRSMADWAAPRILPWLEGPAPALLALDAPLGWPWPLARALSGHVAGEPLDARSQPEDRLFRRLTDTFVEQKLGKRPLEIGANLIARTAWAALELIAELRRHGHELPLCWSPGPIESSAVIEVYPAATLLAHGLDSSPEDKAARRLGVLEQLETTLDFGRHDPEEIARSADAHDSVVCLLAGFDFLDGSVWSPPSGSTDQIRREGWIWFRFRRASRGLSTVYRTG